MKVALVFDWLTEFGGAEQVFLAFHKLFPDAPIYTSQYKEQRIKCFKDADVRTSWFNFLPASSRRLIVPLRQRYFKKLDLSGYDLVISVTGCDAKFIKTTGVHLCYCHVPTQYYWGKYDEYLKNPGFGVLNPLIRPVFKLLTPTLRKKDFAAAKNPTEIITISEYAKRQIKRYYKREAKVINPPVNVDTFSQAVDNYKIEKGKCQTNKSHNKTIKMQESQAANSEQKFCTVFQLVENLPKHFYLNYSRQVNWKRLDLAVLACIKLKKHLVLIGEGPENKKLKKLAHDSPFITFLKPQDQETLAVIASKAKGFIFTSEEPFGIAPVEAMSVGCPVIAYKKGGAMDYIKPEKNGIFFSSQTVNSLCLALKKFEKKRFRKATIKRSAQRFSADKFNKKIKEEINAL